MRPRLSRKAYAQVGVGEKHVLFPGWIAELVTAVARWRLEDVWFFATKGERPDQHAVEPDLQLVTRPHAPDVVHIVPVQPDREVVLTVEHEVMADADPSARAEWEVVAHSVVLYEQNRHLIDLARRSQRSLANGKSRRLPRRRQVPLHQGR